VPSSPLLNCAEALVISSYRVPSDGSAVKGDQGVLEKEAAARIDNVEQGRQLSASGKAGDGQIRPISEIGEHTGDTNEDVATDDRIMSIEIDIQTVFKDRLRSHQTSTVSSLRPLSEQSPASSFRYLTTDQKSTFHRRRLPSKSALSSLSSLSFKSSKSLSSLGSKRSKSSRRSIYKGIGTSIAEGGGGRLPCGWERQVAADGRPYYVNHIDKTTQWQLPGSGAVLDTSESTTKGRRKQGRRSSVIAMKARVMDIISAVDQL